MIQKTQSSLKHARLRLLLKGGPPLALRLKGAALKGIIATGSRIRLAAPGAADDGPQLQELERKYPEARFTGVRSGEGLAIPSTSADKFVFLSDTDMSGLVMLAAMASPTRFDATGPRGGVHRVSSAFFPAPERIRFWPRGRLRRGKPAGVN